MSPIVKLTAPHLVNLPRSTQWCRSRPLHIVLVRLRLSEPQPSELHTKQLKNSFLKIDQVFAFEKKLAQQIILIWWMFCGKEVDKNGNGTDWWIGKFLFWKMVMENQWWLMLLTGSEQCKQKGNRANGVHGCSFHESNSSNMRLVAMNDLGFFIILPNWNRQRFLYSLAKHTKLRMRS